MSPCLLQEIVVVGRVVSSEIPGGKFISVFPEISGNLLTTYVYQLYALISCIMFRKKLVFLARLTGVPAVR